jgi:hypothetical protein
MLARSAETIFVLRCRSNGSPISQLCLIIVHVATGPKRDLRWHAKIPTIRSLGSWEGSNWIRE